MQAPVTEEARSQIRELVASGLTVVSIGTAYTLARYGTPSPTLYAPWVLLLLSCLQFLPIRAMNVISLQRLAALYLVFVAINQTSLQHLSLSAIGTTVNVSITVPIVLTAGGIYLLMRKKATKKQSPGDIGMGTGWVLALSLLGAHMILLGALLGLHYGYGYNESPKVAGQIALYVLLYKFLWDALGSSMLRWTIGVISCLHYGLMWLGSA